MPLPDKSLPHLQIREALLRQLLEVKSGAGFLTSFAVFF